ncbi:MAG: HlyD family secretion protein [Nitrospirae bacterium]|nr:MAG: HlyD family secretion protein [Nitrospirota bacterium]
MKKAIIAIAIIFLVAVTGHIAFSKKREHEPKKEDVQTVSSARYVAAEGKMEVMPGFEVEVGSELDGKIAEFFVKEGYSVKKGALIARLENKDIQAKLNEAKAELSVSKSKLKEVASGAREEEIKKAKAALEAAIADKEMAEKEFKRYEELFKEGFVPKSALDEKERILKVAAAGVKEADEEKKLLEKGPKQETLKLNEDTVKRAEATVEYFEKLLEKTAITAPISGKIIRRYLHKGEMISKEMNTSLVAIADLDNTWINAEVDETDAAKINIGYPVEVKSDAYPGSVFEGEVAEISDYIGARKIRPNNLAKNTDMKIIQVKIKLKGENSFKPGMTVDVRIMPKV